MGGNDYGERAEREPVRGSGGKAPGGGQGAKPPEAGDISEIQGHEFRCRNA